MKRTYLLLPVSLISLFGAFYLTVKPDAVAVPIEKPVVAKTEPIATNATLLAAVNAERAKYGAPALVENPKLDQSAQAKACDEYDNHYFGHVDSNGKHGYQLAEEMLGLPGHYSENITQPTPVTTTQSMHNWNTSLAHHKAMINSSYSLTGFGVCGNQVVEHFYTAS
jgi:uncharacterized protein YkwD